MSETAPDPAPAAETAETPESAAAGPAAAAAHLDVTVAGAGAGDADRAVARLDPVDLARIGARSGDLLRLEAARVTYARALPAHPAERGRRLALLDSVQRANLRVGLGEAVRVSRAEGAPAEEVVLTLRGGVARLTPELLERVKNAMLSTPAFAGDGLRARLVGGRTLTLEIAATRPGGPVIVTEATRLVVEGDDAETAAPRRAETAAAAPGGYAALGGLAPEIAQVREMVELPLKRPDLFRRLGVDAPRGVLFTGPPGSGKTLLARAVAEECGAAFFVLDAPSVMSKHYGDSEAKLRELFKAAEKQSPSVIFIDEIDAIAPKRDAMAGEKQLERRVVAQLLALMDGLEARRGVVVMAATNLPDSIDPALRRPGRFDREIAFTPPDPAGRAEILAIHTARMPLAADVDLAALAASAHGYTGADLAALSREAGLAALRRARDAEGGYPADAAALTVTAEDFEDARARVAPSAVREVMIETPDVRWSDVGGAAEAKQALIEAVIWPLRHGPAFRRLGLEPAKGVLLYGPPGGGKTHLARALANEAQTNFISIRGAQLLSRYVGESERAVREIFAKARLAAPCVLFFDEIDALAPARGQGDVAVTSRVVAQLLTEIDGVEELRGVFLLGATNRPDQIDPALLRPGRFDRLIELPAPDEATRREVLTIHARDLPLSPEVDLGAIAGRTAGWMGADLRALCQSAGRLALRRWIARPSADADLDALRVEPADMAAAEAAHAPRGRPASATAAPAAAPTAPDNGDVR